MEASVSVVIPTLNAEKDISKLLDLLSLQTVVPEESIVIDSQSVDRTVALAKACPLVQVIEIDRFDFDHGGTRNMGYRRAQGEFVLFMTQDAIPADAHMIENLLKPFEDESVAIVSGRQLPKEDARPFERLVREYNYSDKSNKRTKDDIGRLGIKAYFSSDVCCLYRHSALDLIGGIPAPCSTNEDMLAAARCLKHGLKVCYEADARVYHSHNLTVRQQYERNKCVGAFLSEHADELNVPSEVGEGKKMVAEVMLSLIHEGKLVEVFAFGFDCVARLLGNRAGRMMGRK